MTELVVNTILEWRNETTMEIVAVQRILWVSSVDDTVIVINIAEPGHLPEAADYSGIISAVENGLARKLAIDPYAKFMAPAPDFVSEHQDRRDRRWFMIKDIVYQEPAIYDARQRGPLVREASKIAKVHKREVYRQLNNFWVRGKMINALLPEFELCGAPGKEKNTVSGKKRGRPSKVLREDLSLGGVNITELDKRNIRFSVTKWYSTREQNTLVDTYTEMKMRLYNDGVYFANGKPVPISSSSTSVMSFNQFRYWASKFIKEMTDTLEKRLGQRNYMLKKRPLLGNATVNSFGPGYMYEIDATILNVYIVSCYDRNRIIGRPVVYIVKDVFSRLVCGFYVGLEGPSWLGAMLALENTVSDKVTLCATYDIQIEPEDWPAHHLPQVIRADRGEFEGYNPENLINSLGIRVDNTPPYRADFKGIVEQHFELLDKKLGNFVPGKIRQEIRERGEPDYRLTASLTLDEIRKVIVLLILQHNKSELSKYPLSKAMTEDHVPPIPAEIWHWGMSNITGQLQEKPLDVVRLNLMPRETASVTREGIYFKKRHYSCDYGIRKSWFKQVSESGHRFKIDICYDPRNVEFIYIPHSNGTGFEKCQLLDQYARYRGVSIFDVEDQEFCEEVESKRRQTDQGQNAFETKAQVTAVLEESKVKSEQTRDPLQSNATKVKGIKENRKAETALHRDVEKWELGTDNTTERNQRSPDISDTIDYAPSDGTDSLMNLLMQQYEERRAQM